MTAKAGSPLVLDPRKEKNEFVNPKEVLRAIGLEGNMKFADFGCGGGYYSLPAAKMVGEHGKVYAVDILKNELQSVASKAKMDNLLNVETIWADLEVPGSTKLPDNSIDIVFLAHVFYQSDKHSPILEEAKRVVKTSGKVVIVEWEKVAVPFGPPVNERVSKDDSLEAAKNSGLELVGEFEAGSYHYGLVLRKIGGAAPEAPQDQVTYE